MNYLEEFIHRNFPAFAPFAFFAAIPLFSSVAAGHQTSVNLHCG
ncbi:MAG: hypothetical protein ACXW6J_26340 [Candidatus Binatia bacterium]